MAEIAVGMADLKVGKGGDVLTTVLGSCIGLCLFSQKHQAGGLLHIMMPSAGDNATRPDCKKAKYADTGVPELIKTMKISFGVQTTDLIAKMFGGAKVLKDVERNIGSENVAAVQQCLKEYGIPIKTHKYGGDKGYRIKMMTDSGTVHCQVFGCPVEEF